MSHTPGPWHKDSANDIFAEDIWIGGIYDTDDARLVAVAPELLAVIKGMLHHHDHDPVGWPQEQCRRCQDAIAAITKAEQ
jgi:hypothetical protein|tara:strand:+ start:867 stop:1106 length:240 start_codon:yes stop_codon:yes gene_type:complete